MPTAGHSAPNPTTGHQTGYLVLSKAERAKGFARPVRMAYIHSGKAATIHDGALVKKGVNGCGAKTTLSVAIAETYARDPKFYSGAFCVGCRTHRPVSEFVWEGADGEVVGT